MSDDTPFDKKTLAYVLILVMSGNAGVVLLNKTQPDLRADAFTATDAKELKSEIKLIYSIQQTMLHRMGERERADKELKSLVEAHLRRHP